MWVLRVQHSRVMVHTGRRLTPILYCIHWAGLFFCLYGSVHAWSFLPVLIDDQKRIIGLKPQKEESGRVTLPIIFS